MSMLMNTFIYFYVHIRIFLLFIYEYIYLKYNLTFALKPSEVTAKAQI